MLFRIYLDKSVSTLLATNLKHLGNLQLQSVKLADIMYQSIATFKYITYEFTGQSVLEFSDKYLLTEDEANKIALYNLNDFQQLFMFASSDDFQERALQDIMKMLYVKVEDLLTRLDSTVISLAYQQKVWYPLARFMDMDTLTIGLLNTSLAGLQRLKLFSESIIGERSIKQVIGDIQGLELLATNGLYQSRVVSNSQQLWLISYKVRSKLNIFITQQQQLRWKNVHS